MFWVRGSILYFFLLVLEISLDLSPDASYKQGGFSETLLKKGLKFVLSRGDGIVAFNLSFVLLPAEVNPILEKRGCEKDAFVARGFGHVEMIFILSTKIIALHMQAPIVKVEVLGLKSSIPGGGVYLAMFLALDKRF